MVKVHSIATVTVAIDMGMCSTWLWHTNTPFGVVVSLVIEESEGIHSITPVRLRRVEGIEKPVALQQEKEQCICNSIPFSNATLCWLNHS